MAIFSFNRTPINIPKMAYLTSYSHKSPLAQTNRTIQGLLAGS
jgi:hypothetical protein